MSQSDSLRPTPAILVWPVRLAAVALIAALVMAALSPLGYRLGWWSAGFAIIDLFKWSVYLAAGAGLVALLALIPRAILIKGWRAAALPVFILAVSGAMVWNAWTWKQTAETVPPIHDITTDTQDPPAFVALLDERADAPNPPGYAGEETAEQQREAYPDVLPLVVPAPKDEVFEAALGAARAMGWTIVAAVPEEGRIEASETSFWYAFTDDIVIRLKDVAVGTMIDVRSKSRIGRSDLGANAARIKAYLEAVAKRV